MVATTTKCKDGTPSTGKWLVMFYVAGDNNLSPLFVDQLKAIKDAGFDRNVEVIVRFDPNEPDLQTQTFNVNRERKKSSVRQIGDGNDSFVRNMIEDLEKEEPDKKALGFIPPYDALDRFITFCIKEYPARHYMLFLLGHGLIVGNDTFLPDELPQGGIGLRDLGGILKKHFKNRSLELLGLHACAMSGIEILYQLQGTAKYMLGSEGLSFVHSWPYRQAIKRLLNGLKREECVEEILEDLYWHTFYNAKDFLISGFHLELSLINLDSRRIRPLTQRMQELVRRLKQALTYECGDAIQLAHLKSQSYFSEFYTDLFDFCLCLKRQCKGHKKLDQLALACENVMKELRPIGGNDRNTLLDRFKALVIHSQHFGWRSQYSHGLSILFPWIEPRRNVEKGKQVMELYKRYEFNEALKPHSWFSFLEKYFEETMRKPREKEDMELNLNALKLNDDAPKQYKVDDGDQKLWSRALKSLPDKPTGASDKPTAGSGDSCDCPDIKNFPKKKKGKDKLVIL